MRNFHASSRSRSRKGISSWWLMLLSLIMLGAFAFMILVSPHLEKLHQTTASQIGRWRKTMGSSAKQADLDATDRFQNANLRRNDDASSRRRCASLSSKASDVLFMIVGGRGYHDLRVRVMLRTWARCVAHVLVFTDPSVNMNFSDYFSPHRHVYISAGDAWRRRPYLPMSHMDTLGKLIWGRNSPAANVSWVFLVSDRTFVNVGALLDVLPSLDSSAKGYYGQVANSTHKESFGFHDYVDLNTGILLTATLLSKVIEPAHCKDQKIGGGTFDMFDAKLGNCVFFLKGFPKWIPGFVESEAPAECESARSLNGAISYGKVEARQMSALARCAGLTSRADEAEIAEMIGHESRPLRPSAVAVHVMARETHLREIVSDCEDTWAKNIPKVYYHSDKSTAAEHYVISRGRWAVSANVANDTKARQHRIAALNLPPKPDSGGEHWTVSHDKGLSWNTWLRYKMQAIFLWSVQASWAELHDIQWYVYVDDDTYVLWEPMLELLRRYDPAASHYFGRPLQEEGYPIFVGGGAGIVLSRAAAMQILAAGAGSDCDPLHLKWVERTHQGGDAWLGDCAEVAGVQADMEYGFYPQPPVANLFHLFKDAVSFHGVEDHHAMHAALSANASGERYDVRCVPVFIDHKYSCLPHFIIGGVPKAGTTSLYKYLMQHPQVLPAADKELTFWGNFFTPKRRPSRDEVMSDYLQKFPKISPGDFKVTGEATPGYLYCSTCPTYILKYIPKVRFIFTLRNPVVKAYSEYLNKVADKTVMRWVILLSLHSKEDASVTEIVEFLRCRIARPVDVIDKLGAGRYLHKRIDNKMEKELSTFAPPFESLVDNVARTMASCLPNNTFSMMDEYTQEMEANLCYVNPFVGEGRYARYLSNWLDVVPKRQVLLLNFDEWTSHAAEAMQAISEFLLLPPFDYRLEEAHNTHIARSVHVDLEGASNVSQIASESLEASLDFNTQCILHEFFIPFATDLEELLQQYGYPPMRWDTGHKGGMTCPSNFRYWRHLKGRPIPLPTQSQRVEG